MKSIVKKTEITAALCILITGIISLIIIFCVFVRSDPYYKSSKLIKAIEKHDYEQLEALLIDGTNPNVPEFRSIFITRLCETSPVTPLGFATKQDDLKAVKLLLQYGAVPEPSEESKSWPLGDAISTNGNNSFEIVKLLIENGADPYETAGYENAFYKVARTCCVDASADDYHRLTDIMDYLLNYSGDDPQTVFKKSDEAISLTTYAIYYGRNPELIRYLLENGDSVDIDSVYKGYKDGISFYDWCHLDENKYILDILKAHSVF